MQSFDNIDVLRIGNKWFFSDGTVLPVVSGGDGTGEGAGAGTGSEGAGATGGNPPSTQPPAGHVSQDEVTRIAAREKDEGKRSATRELLEALGVKDVDEAKNILADHRKRSDAELSESQRAAKAAADAESKAVERERVAGEVAHAAQVKLALIDAGTPRANLEACARLVDSKPGDAEDAIKAAVEAAKKMLPAAFIETATDETNGGKPRPRTDPAGKPPAGGGNGKSAIQVGMERATSEGDTSGDQYAFMQPAAQ